MAAYAREMVDGDLPASAADFDRWVCRRVLSPAGPLFHEVGLLLSEDPATSRARKIHLYHATLAGVATGHHAHSKLTRYVKVSGALLSPIVEALVGAELVERCAEATVLVLPDGVEMWSWLIWSGCMGDKHRPGFVPATCSGILDTVIPGPWNGGC